MRLVVTPPWLIIAGVAGWPAAGSVCAPDAANSALFAEWTRIETATLASPALDSVQLTESSLPARLWHRANKRTSESGRRTLRIVHDYLFAESTPQSSFSAEAICGQYPFLRTKVL